jgi:Domain of unknown function (DUF4386)
MHPTMINAPAVTPRVVVTGFFMWIWLRRTEAASISESLPQAVERLEYDVKAASAGPRTASTIGGWSLIAATLLFGAVFVYLAGAFDYPAILERPASEVLPRLLSLGAEGRAVWVVYGLVPLLLLPTSIGVHTASREAAPCTALGAVIAAVLGAAAMMVGLLRWPSLHWHLALAYASGSPATRDSIAAVFAAANSFLGNFIGEFLGELFLNAFFLCASFALAHAAGSSRRWLLYAGSAATALGGVSMFRNVTAVVSPIAAVNNAILPIWMLLLGVALLTHRAQARPDSSA